MVLKKDRVLYRYLYRLITVSLRLPITCYHYRYRPTNSLVVPSEEMEEVMEDKEKREKELKMSNDDRVTRLRQTLAMYFEGCITEEEYINKTIELISE